MQQTTGNVFEDLGFAPEEAAQLELRAGEVRALEWGDVELNTGVIIVRRSTLIGATSTPKSGHEREIPIAAPHREILLAAGQRRGLVA